MSAIISLDAIIFRPEPYPHQALGVAVSLKFSSGLKMTTYHCCIGVAAGWQITQTSHLIHTQQILGNLNTGGQ